MEVIGFAFSAAYDIANIPIPIFGYVISLWEIFLFSLFGGLIIWLVVNVFNN